MYLALAILMLGTAESSRTVIPVGHGHPGRPYVNATIPDITGERIIQTTLTAYNTAGAIQFTDQNPYESGWEQNVTLQIGSVASFYPQLLVLNVPENSTAEELRDFANLGIGRGSPLVEQYGSIDFVKSSDDNESIILNSTLDWFTRTACSENFVMRVPFIITPLGDLVQFQVGFGSSAPSAVDYLLTPSPFIMSLPDNLLSAAMMVMRFSTNRRFPESGNFIFWGCSLIRPLLPNLHLTVGDLAIILTPEDYTRHLGEDDRCDLLVRPPPTSGQHVINPFMLPDMNVRFTNSTFSICDSNVTPSTNLE